MTRYYVTTTIPYVNARPHLGFALELVQADVLARHRRQRGDRVRLLNLVHRVTSLVHRRYGGRVPHRPPNVLRSLADACREAPGRIDAALEAYDFRLATAALWDIVDEANRALDHTRPWEPARSGGAATVLAALLQALLVLAEELRPFLPGLAAHVAAQSTPVDGVLPEPRHLAARTGDRV